MEIDIEREGGVSRGYFDNYTETLDLYIAYTSIEALSAWHVRSLATTYARFKLDSASAKIVESEIKGKSDLTAINETCRWGRALEEVDNNNYTYLINELNEDAIGYLASENPSEDDLWLGRSLFKMVDVLKKEGSKI